MTPIEMRKRLEALGWTQTKAAIKLQVTKGAISRWINGKRPIPGLVEAALSRRW